MKRRVTVTMIVDVEIDETKFTPAFLEEFRGYMYDFSSVDDHIEHIAQLAARGILDCDWPSVSIEGYGRASDMGIKANVRDWEMEIER